MSVRTHWKQSDLLSLSLVGIVAGLFSGLLGVGGGIVMVPLMVGFLRFGQHRAHATSLAAIVLIALSGASRFGLAGELEFAVGLALGAGGIVGSTVGAHLMHRLSATALRGVFGSIMILAGVQMVLNSAPGIGQAPESVVGVILGIIIGLVAGIASGVAGIGGGVLMVPAMVFLLGLPQHAAEGTSLLAVLFTALAGTRVNVKKGQVRLGESAVIGATGVVSAQLGALLALGMSGQLLSRVFGGFVVFLGVRTLSSVYRGESRHEEDDPA